MQTLNNRDISTLLNIKNTFALFNLIVTSKNLINQTIIVIFKIASNKFKIFKYQNVNKRIKIVANKKIIINNLTHDHNLFNNNSANVNVIIVTSYIIFAYRHDFVVQNRWRINDKKIIKIKVDKMLLKFDFYWFDNLNKCINIVVIDEIYYLKQLFN